MDDRRSVRIGSLFSGIGGLDIAVSHLTGATVAWHCQYDPTDRHQYAARVLAHRYPAVPNLGDITRADFRSAEPVDILTGGFPCPDVSHAGRREGLTAANRSGLWAQMARAIHELNPRLVVIENVPGLLSARADGDVERCAGCLGDAPDVRPLRALGAVLADLSALRLDAEWAVVPASAVGAPHQRRRVFLVARPATTAPQDTHGSTRFERGVAAPGQAPRGWSRPDAGRRGRAPHPGSSGVRLGRLAAADAQHRRDAHHGGPSRTRCASSAAVPVRHGRSPAAAPHGPGAGHGPSRWGPYGDAVARWEQRTRPAPDAIDARGRLSVEFVEWMMGYSAGWATGVPGVPASAALKALGNAVVPQQAEAALRVLVERLEEDIPAAV